MRFRGKIIDASAMRDFTHISQGLSKLAKECVLRAVAKKVYFIISDEDSGPRKPFVWCELPVDFYFKEYNYTGLSEEYNEIYLTFSTAMLARSLSTLKQNAKSLKIKLTNKQTPCLTLEVEQSSTEGMQNRQCVHDIPVELLSRQIWGDYAEPQFNDFHVSIEMPHLRSIKNIVERMKNMSSTITVSANKHGRLTLRIKTNMVTLSAHFPDLSVASFAVGQTILPDSDSEEDEVSGNVSAVIDVKKFLMFLTGMQLNNAKTVCSIVHNRMVKFYLEQAGSLSLQYFLTQVSL